MLVGANDVMVDNTILQKFYLLESQKKEVCISLKKEFTEWSKTAREKRSLCENGEMTLEEFQAWLDESKRR